MNGVQIVMVIGVGLAVSAIAGRRDLQPGVFIVILGAAVTSSGRNLRPILSLGLTLVVLNAAVLGLTASWLLPAISGAAAFTLGAILAPPDTITTVSHGREIGLPRRVTSILTGESLVNDATALTLFSIAITAAAHTLRE